MRLKHRGISYRVYTIAGYPGCHLWEITSRAIKVCFAISKGAPTKGACKTETEAIEQAEAAINNICDQTFLLK